MILKSNRRWLVIVPVILLSVMLGKYFYAFLNKKNNNKKDFKKEIRVNKYEEDLIFTRHARCRMECRKISEEEVYAVLRSGKINHRKSDLDADPCPKKALEGLTLDGQQVRIIVADCEPRDKIVTVIDLNHEHECDCP